MRHGESFPGGAGRHPGSGGRVPYRERIPGTRRARTVNTGEETVSTTTRDLKGRGFYGVVLSGNPAATGADPRQGLQVLRLA